MFMVDVLVSSSCDIELITGLGGEPNAFDTGIVLSASCDACSTLSTTASPLCWRSSSSSVSDIISTRMFKSSCDSRSTSHIMSAFSVLHFHRARFTGDAHSWRTRTRFPGDVHSSSTRLHFDVRRRRWHGPGCAPTLPNVTTSWSTSLLFDVMRRHRTDLEHSPFKTGNGQSPSPVGVSNGAFF